MPKKLKFTKQDENYKVKFIVYNVKNKAVYVFVASILVAKFKRLTDTNPYFKNNVLQKPPIVRITHASQFQNYENFVKRNFQEHRKTCFIYDRLLTLTGGDQTETKTADILDEKLRQFKDEKKLTNSIQNKASERSSYSLGKVSSIIGQTIWKTMDFTVSFIWDNPLVKQWFLAKEQPVINVIKSNRTSNEILIGHPYYVDAWVPNKPSFAFRTDTCYSPHTVLFGHDNFPTPLLDNYNGVPFTRDENIGLLIPPNGMNVDQELLDAVNLTHRRRLGRLWPSIEKNKGYSVTQTIIKAKAHLKQVFGITHINNKPLNQVSDERVAKVFLQECEKIIAQARAKNDPRYYNRPGILNYRENVTFYVDRERQILVIFENNSYCSENFFISCYKIKENYAKKFDASSETLLNIGKNVTYHEQQKVQQMIAALARETKVTRNKIYKEFYQTLNQDERMGNKEIRLVQNRLKGRNPIDLPLKEQRLLARYERLEEKYKAFCQENNIPEQNLIV